MQNPDFPTLARAAGRSVTIIEDAPEPLFVGDIVTIQFAEVPGWSHDRRGVVVETGRNETCRLEYVGDDGETYGCIAPRDLLILVRRADA